MMDWEDYRNWVVARRMVGEGAHTDLFAIMGILGEAGELSELFKKEYFHNKVANSEDVLSEMGDLFFYFTSMCHDEGISLDEVMSYNMNKLDNRKDSHYGKTD